MLNKTKLLIALLIFPAFFFNFSSPAGPHNVKRIEVLFLGHNSKHHDSEKLADIFLKEYFKQGINISYTTELSDINEKNLAHYDALVVYANHDTISADQERALLNFVNSGKGFIPLHSASHCFRNSPAIVEMIGGQFDSHQYDSFPAVIADPSHPIVAGIKAFYTKDETYRHKNVSDKIHVITERVEGANREPYTWVREYGKGRVFYTAYGHDDNTFNHPDFLNLVRNGIFWSVGERALELNRSSIADPKYFDGMVPNYERRDPAPKVQEALTPEQSMTLMQVPVGFDLQLFASEPDIVNPIFMNWDEKGRLWVIETIDYPNEVKSDDQGDDRIKIVEDTDGDGKADKFTIFADSLNIPTSFVFKDDGILVSMAPSFLFLKDTDGDGKADVRKPMLEGWGKFDTHAQASNLRYGFDNKIWGVVGYSGFKGKVGNDSLKFGNGLYRFNRDGSGLEFLSGTSNNTWGLGFSEEFDVFISTANNTHTGFFGLPKRFLDKGKVKESGIAKIDGHYGMHVATKNLRQVDVHGGFTAAAGHSLYTARAFPEEYWNRVAFVTEPTGRLVHRVQLKQQGSGFVESGDGWNILTSADEWAGPVQSEVGPDGALWIADWYDFIIQHNPTPSIKSSGIDAVNGKGNAYINPLRDRERGRIYRVAYRNNDKRNTLSLDKNGTEGLIAALSNDNLFWRMTAQRLLVEKKDRSIMKQLYKLIENKNVDAAGINAPAIHALWTLHGLGVLDGSNPEAMQKVYTALRHPSGGVRKAAIEVMPRSPSTLVQLKQAKVFDDSDHRVRLAALLALADMKSSADRTAIVKNMLAAKENTNDVWIKQALAVLNTSPAKTTENVKVSTNENKSAVQVIQMKVLKDVMKFDKEVIAAKAGTTVRLVLDNPDFMQHNLVLIKPGTANKVGAAADSLARDADGAKMNYVPRMNEVIAATPLINPGQSFTLTFKVPSTPGEYPYLCTFPGHWRIMRGILKVTK